MAERSLEVVDIHSGYGDALVLHGVSFSLAQGRSLAVLGRNGVGKTTLLLTLMGETVVRSGSVIWGGEDITRKPPHARARAGLGWIPQERDVFPSLTVEENLTVVARPGHWTRERVYALFPRLAERRDHKGNHLSGGEQQMLAIARTLMINPAVLLLDEPLEGLAPIVVEELSDAISKTSAEGSMGIILVEQHAEIALSLTEQAIVIERGAIVHRGPSAELLENSTLLDRFIGLSLANASGKDAS
jgi:branched-chain amino acid transport system ATP-binding protein